MKKIEITNPEKIIANKSKTTKLQVVEYYNDISSLILPHLNKRPLSVIRCHDNIKKDVFFKKHPSNDRDMVEIFNDNNHEYFFIKDNIQLLYQVQMGTIEFHPWACQLPRKEKPNLMIFDLDPGKNISQERLLQGVFDLKSILDNLNLQSYIKTSGGKGYHIVLPFSFCKNWDSFSKFSQSIALLMEAKWPKLYTTNIRKNERKGKIFIDWLRNKRGATCACAYSLRARDNLPISFPIEWKDVDKFVPNQINISNYKQYLKGNPWKDFFDIQQRLK